jgi:butyrate kinase
MMEPYLFLLNPGSTSTKIAVYQGDRKVAEEVVEHQAKAPDLLAELPLREEDLRRWLQEKVPGIRFDAIVSRGGLLKPIPAGAYRINQQMLDDLRFRPQAQHASNLGAFLAAALAAEDGIPAYIVDPVSVDEFSPLARYSGLPELPRRALSHALNIRAVAHQVAHKMGKKLEDCRFVVAHLGGGISVVPLDGGRIVDANSSNTGGPFSPERSGPLPPADVVRMAFAGQHSEKEILARMTKQGGLTAYLGTNDAREVERRIDQGDLQAEEIYQSMAYQIAKEIGAMSTVFRGQVDRIILTGGLAHSHRLISWIECRIRFIAEVVVYPGEGEMEALAAGGLRILRGEELAKEYVS